MMDDVPTRLIVAYALIALLIVAATGIAWWSVHFSNERIDARKEARRRAARRLNNDL